MSKKRLLAIIISLGFLIGIILLANFRIPVPRTNASARRLEQQTNQYQIEIEILSIEDSRISYRIINNNPNKYIVLTNMNDLDIPRIYRRQGIIWMPVKYVSEARLLALFIWSITSNDYHMDRSWRLINYNEGDYLMVLNVLLADFPMTLNDVTSNQGTRTRLATRFTIPIENN